MIDSKRLRGDLLDLQQQLATRGYTLDMEFWQTIETERKSLQMQTEALQSRRNAGAKEVGALKKSGGDASELMSEMQGISSEIKVAEDNLRSLQERINTAAMQIPNIPASDVPVGESEDDNVEVRQWGTPRQFDFDIQDHTFIGETLGMLDFEAAIKLTGSRFNVLKGQLAQMHRALIQFMLNTHTIKYGYTETYVPYIVNSESLRGTGQLPKFEDDLFKLTNHTNNEDTDFYLIPTAEVPMTNLVRGERLDISELPLKFTAHTPCFRSEAGSHGRDTRGLIRQHQFEKVEMVNIATADQSDDLLEAMTGQAEYILQQLNLPYRTVMLCTGDMGFSAQKTYDIEVWLPSQDTYREISSCSNCGDFQARRMGTRVKDGKQTSLAHTLNGSGLAVGRTLLAIMENYQNADGSITIPEVLRPYMGGVDTISA
ncbi:serine--tRNA ligase [Psychrobacter sp. M13]|uniref:serine--tRNA ligase n=1 Tax=Psychrobacter sp. M13 TaxID=3067275 RepID=UPI00273C6963|nr:serine--tRNA ligase [Psychrobacter sp. M13]WLP93823.1 serine--tRNA ligase [Psychrobacter sp. M13]